MDAIEVKRRVYDWCRQEDLFGEEVEDEKTTFHIKVRPPTGGGAVDGAAGRALDALEVVQPKLDADKIVVFTGVNFDEELMAPVRLNPFYEDVIRNLEMTLESRPEAYLLDVSDGLLKSILIMDEIFFDGLTKDRFMKSLRSTNKTLVLSFWILTPILDAIQLPDEGASAKPSPGYEGADQGAVARAAEETELPSSRSDAIPPEDRRAPERPAGPCCPNPACGGPLRPGVRFCTACGTPVDMPKEQGT